MDRRAPVDPFRTHIESLELAGGLLDGFIQMDNLSPSFLDVTRIAMDHHWPTVSGLTDIDYPNIEDLANMKQISTVSKLPLPAEVMEHFGHLQCHCMMGLFTEISRAWLTIDSDIYVWAYEKGTDIAFFDGLGETIVNVGLVKPKPGVFNSFVKYLLILTTTIEVVILGVTFSSNQEGHSGALEEMHLLPDPVFVIPTDGVTINTCACTDLGRIFLGGKDGNLYEIVYQAESGWFGKRYKKVNHSKSTLSFLIPSFLSYPFRTDDAIIQISVDNSRHILYTLSEHGTIEIYDLGDKGTCMCRITSLTEAQMVQNATNFIPYLEPKTFMSIVKICAVEAYESPYVNLVVITKTGVRFYYSTSNVPTFSTRPCSLHLMHIRLPPGFSAGTLVNKPSNVHKALYKKGSVVLVTTPRGDVVEKDILWCLSSDPYPFRPYLAEMQSAVSLDGNVWAIEEVKTNAICNLLPCLKYPEIQQQLGLVADPPLIVRQHMEPPRKYVVLTSQGVEILMKLRPVDMLRQLLVENGGPEGKAIKTYFKEQTEDQACATCLILACLDSTQNIQLSEWATRALLLYGADPVLPPENVPAPTLAPSTTPHQYSMHGGFNPGVMSTPLPANQQHFVASGYPANQPLSSPGQHNPNQQSFGNPGLSQSFQQPQLGRSFSQQQQLGRSMNQPQTLMSPVQQQQTIGSPLQQQPQFSTPLSHHQQFPSSRFHQQQQLETSLHHSTYLEGSVIHPQMEAPIFPRLHFENTLAHQQQQQQQQQLPQQQQQPQSFGTPLPRHSLQQQSMFSPQVTQQTPVDRVVPSQHYASAQSQLLPLNYNMCQGYSAKHNGLYLYLGRILGPIWNLPTVHRTPSADKKGSFVLSVLTREDCVFILGHLHALKSFLERTPQYSASVMPGASMNSSVAKKTAQDGFETPTQRGSPTQLALIQQKEKQSLDAFKILLSHVTEVMGLWKILTEHQFHLVAGSLNENQQAELVGSTFRSLILAGHDLCSLLINSLVSSYLSDDASVDAISAKLREVSPHLYRNEDAACSKANEMLLSARNIQNVTERQSKLEGALQLCKSVAPHVNMPLICQWFASSQYYEGILELCLTCALKLDPKGLAVSYYNNKQPPGDEEGYRAYVERMQCYKEITSVLDQMYEQTLSSPYSPSMPSSPGRKVAAETTHGFKSSGEMEQQARKLLEGALNSSDELLHVAIYEWMLSKQLLGELVFMSQPSYENFIKRKAEASSNAIYLFDLLWKYYEKNDNHAAAAKVLVKLATTPGSQVTLTERIAYLAHAGVCMRSDRVGCAPQLGVFLRELEDKLEVARLQQQILDAISAKPETVQTREAMVQLNSGLVDITELYEKYAEPFQLWDCKLAIIHCSGHHDPGLVEHVWLNIIETELQNCSALRGSGKMAVVMSKVKLLCQEYDLLPRCVPIPFLVKQLELLSCRIGAGAMQVHPIILTAGYTFVKLIQVYDVLISESDMCWFESGREFHLHEVVGCLVDGFLRNPSSVPKSERNLVATKAEDLLTKCLIFLMSKTGTEDLVETLQGVKTRLSRLQKEL